MKRVFTYLLVLTLISCGEDFKSTPAVDYTVDITLPEGMDVALLDNASLTVKNISNGTSTTVSSADNRSFTMHISPGYYTFDYCADARLDNGASALVRASAGGTEIRNAATLTLKAFANAGSDDLIISELFFTGTLQPTGTQYNGDQYIKLFNNTDRTVYADGLTIFESLFLTTQKYNYSPDITADAVAVSALYTIPGSGTDHPVGPGEELLIADIAIDHRAINTNSFDLSHADFEWYDESTNPKDTDIDNPAVENLDKWYCYTNTVWQLHNRGFKSYGLARLNSSAEAYLSDHYYRCSYDMVTIAGSFPMEKDGYYIANDDIVDIVNLSVSSSWQWNPCIPALDSGWTSAGTTENDKTRYFRAVRRKTVTEGDMVRLSDTNNSSADFDASAIPSEIERQGTAIAADGTKYSK